MLLQHQNLAFFIDFIDNLDKGVLIVSAETGTVVYHNHAFVADYQEDKIKGLASLPLVLGVNYPLYKQKLNDAVNYVLQEKKRITVSVSRLKGDNTLQWLQVEVYPYPHISAELKYLVFVVTEDNLHSMLGKQAAILYDTQKVGGWEFISSESIFLWTKEVYALFEIDEGVELDISLLRSFFADQEKQFFDKQVERTLETGELLDVELSFISAKGHKKWVRVIAKRLKEENGELHLQGGFRDCTEEKRVVEKVTRAKERAENASTAKDDFLSTMSHEIRTPLNAVIGMTHLLLEESLTAPQLKKLNTLKFSAENLHALVNDILDLNKIVAGKVTLEKEAFYLKEMIDSVQESVLVKAQEKGIQIKVKHDKRLPKVIVGDKVRLTQILNNLVSNALKFTHVGSVTVEQVVQSIDKENHIVSVLFAVTDTGIGIPEDRQDEIFDRFTQASSSTTRKYGGTGLGLSIVKHLVELHKGQITLWSKEGEGSRFEVEMELEVGEQKELYTEDDEILTYTLNGLDVLLVEDNEMNQLVATNFLQNWHAKVDYAVNGIEAVERVREKDYDIVLMDLQMPEMDGYEATEYIRALPEEKYKDLPIVALTASALLDVKGKVLESGMNDYLVKPFDPTDLYAKIVRHTKHKIQEEKVLTTTQEQMEEVHLPLHNLISLEGVLNLANGDPSFLKVFLTTVPNTLETFLADLDTVIKKHDYERFKFMQEKVDSTIKLLSFEKLEEQLVIAKVLLKSDKTSSDKLEIIQQRIERVCKKVIDLMREESSYLPD